MLNLLSAPDPEFGFSKKLEKSKHSISKKQLKLKCKVDNPDARVKWYKDGVEISKSDVRFLISNDEGECSLVIREAEPHDSGRYTCRIEEFGKAGENETSCDVSVGGQYSSLQIYTREN